MDKCPKCSEKIESDWRVCTHCKEILSNSEQQENLNSDRHKSKTVVELFNIGDIIGQKYKIIELLGEGGMGSVYKVEHMLLPNKKNFALKIMRSELCYHPNFRDRFLQEAEIAMEFVHEHAVQIREFGETQEAFLYFTMDFSDGKSLREVYITERTPFTERRSLKLTRQILSALKNAHDKGIIHRDLKPENVIVEKRSEEDHALILDFGIAKILDSDQNLTGQMLLGTPDYMSPEQAGKEDLDHRSDIYTVGIMLYEMVVGQVPFYGSTKAIFAGHLFEKPKPPRELSPDLSQETSNIITKALEKDRNMRYLNLSAFIEEIHQILALPKLGKKNANDSRKTVIALGVFAFLVVLSVFIGQRLGDTKKTQVDTDKKQNADKRDNLVSKQINLTQKKDKAPSQQVRVLSPKDKKYFAAVANVHKQQQQTQVKYQQQLKKWMNAETRVEVVVQIGHARMINVAIYSPDNQTIATASILGTVKIWEAKKGKLLRTLLAHNEQVVALAYSPDSRYLVTAANDRRGPYLDKHYIKIWEVHTGKEYKSLAANNRVLSVGYSPDGKTFASLHYKEINIWQSSGELKKTIPFPHPKFLNFRSKIVYSADGQYLFTPGKSGLISIWNIKTGKIIRHLKVKNNRDIHGVRDIACSADGSIVAVATEEKSAIFDFCTGKLLYAFGFRCKVITCSRDGKKVATGNRNTVNIWDTTTGKSIKKINTKMVGYFNSLSFSRDHSQLLVCSWRKRDNVPPAIFDISSGEESFRLSGRTINFESVTFSRSGNFLAVGLNKTVQIWNFLELQRLNTFSAIYKVADISPLPDECFLVVGFPPFAYIINSKSGKMDAKISPNLRNHYFRFFAVAHSPKKPRITIGGRDGVFIQNAKTDLWTKLAEKEHKGKKRPHSVIALDYSPNGKFLALGNNNGFVGIYDTEAKKLLYSLPGHSRFVDTVKYSSDGKWLATFDRQGKEVKIWEPTTGKLVNSIPGHAIKACDFSYDSQYLVIADSGNWKIWNTNTRTLSEGVKAHRSIVDVKFHPQKFLFLTVGSDHKIKIWDAKTRNFLGSLFAIGRKKDWITIAVDNRLETSMDAREEVHFVKGVTAYHFSLLAKQYYSRGLLSQLLGK